MLCRRCGSDCPDTDRFCDSCGAPLTAPCPACGAVNRAAAKFCGSCSAPLGERARDDGAEVFALSRHTPRHLAARVLDSRAALEGERKQVTVLFADIRGSTELVAQLDPEEADGRLGPVLEQMMEAVHRYEGTVNRIQGDGIMALFGAPLALEDHAVRACLAARAILDFVAALPDAPELRVGLHSGEVVVRSISNDLSMDYDVIGVTVHLARRMEESAAPGTARLTAETMRLAEGFVATRPVGMVAVKGLDRPIEVLELAAGAARGTRWEVRAAARKLSGFFGREPEMATLRAVCEQAAAGQGRLIGVVGDAGMGKSRLVHEFLRTAPLDGWTVLKGAVMPFDQNTPHRLIANLVRHWLGVEDGDGRDVIAARLAASLARLDPAIRAGEPALRSLLSLPIADPAWEAAEPALRRARIIDAIKTLVATGAARQPLLIVLEDLHWIDGESQVVIDRLAEGASALRLLIVATFRPEYGHRWAARSFYSQIRVNPLEESSGAALLTHLLGDDEGLKRLKRLLLERTEGTPLFLEEMVRALVDTGALSGAPGDYRLARDVEQIEIPPSVGAVLAARIDRLAPEPRNLLQVAAAIGTDVPLNLLQAVAGLPEDQLGHMLAVLQTSEFIYETRQSPAVEYTFKHVLTRDVAYAGVLHRRRRAIHASVVEAIETLNRERLDEHVERLAYHAVHAEQWDKAVDYLCRAGRRANEHSAHREARGFFEQALTALDKLPDGDTRIEKAIEIRLGLRVALATTAELRRIRDNLAEAEQLARAVMDRPRLALINLNKATILTLLGELEDAIEAGKYGLQLAGELDDIRAAVGASFSLGQAYWFRGDFAQAAATIVDKLPAITGALRHSHLGTTGTTSVLCLTTLANSYSLRGLFAQAFATVRDAQAIAVETGRYYDLSFAHLASGLAHLNGGDVARAVEDLDKAAWFCRTGEIDLLYPSVAGHWGRALALSGQLDEAKAVLEKAVEQSKRQGLVPFEAWCGVALAETDALAGLAGEAEDLAGRALDLARRHHYRPVEVYALRVLGSLAAAGGRDAETWHRDALALARSLAMDPELAAIHDDLAGHCERAGRHAAAAAERAAADAFRQEMGIGPTSGRPRDAAANA